MFEIEKEYNGFVCKSFQKIDDIKAEGYVFEHEKTKAKLVYLKNNDKNKVFSIGFRTPVSNNTGVPHIIEHSVLCGSRKYPLKEPFVELLKSSVYTFLNAMTMPDHTLYPIASTNEKDFFNLMDVYLDAVFYPNIYNKKEIFMQEGWHYELLDKKDSLEYKGVVYNEMKGVYSSPENVLFYKGMSSLYPKTTYFYEYGGLPSDIPNLTYEEFLDFHKKYYHPSNSYIFLYGDVDADECMKRINDEYLSNYEYKKVDSKIKLQESFKKEKEIIDSYPIGENEDSDNKAYMSLNFSLATSMNMELAFAFTMLEYYLLETAASPLKKAILEQGLCNEISGFYEDDMLQPFMGINFIEIDEKDKERIKEEVFDVLQKIVDNGIDQELMEATINRVEFSYRNIVEESPRGLGYNFSMFKTWLYDGDALAPLFFEESINTIRSKFKNGYFENIIKEYFIENMHRSTILLLPDKELSDKNANKLKDELEKVKASMDDKKINEIIKDTKNLIKLQSKPDTKEAIDTIPTLSLDELEKKVEKFEVDEKKIENVNVVLKELDTNKILYCDLNFNTQAVDIKDISYINLLANVLTEVSTKKYSYEKLAKNINKVAGDLSFNTEVLVNSKNNDEYIPLLVAHIEGLETNTEKMFSLLKEIILNTRFDEESKLKEIISRLRVMLEQSLVQSGNATVFKRIQSYYSQSGKYYEKISGVDFYRFICELDNNFEQVKEVVKGKLEELSEKIFKRENMHVTFVGEEGTFVKHTKKLENLITSLPKYQNVEDAYRNTYKFNVKPLNEGIMTQSDVQYVGMGYDFTRLGYVYDGTMMVLRQIISLDYLWNTVRVKGGAYGCSLAIGLAGDFLLSSYRDPNLVNTLKSYKELAKFVKKMKNDKEFYKYVIGTVGTLDKPKSPYNKVKIAERRKMRNISYEDIQRERDEILNATPKDMKMHIKMIEKIIKKNAICVVGNERVIKANKKVFDRIVNLK